MKQPLLALAVLLMTAAGCADATQPATTTTDRRGGVDSFGLELFEERVVGANPGCVTCHSLEENVTLVGPSLFAIESPVAGLTTAEYVRQSIIEPDAFVVDGFVAGQMFPGWDQYLTPEQIDSLVTLLTDR